MAADDWTSVLLARLQLRGPHMAIVGKEGPLRTAPVYHGPEALYCQWCGAPLMLGGACTTTLCAVALIEGVR